MSIVFDIIHINYNIKWFIRRIVVRVRNSVRDHNTGVVRHPLNEEHDTSSVYAGLRLERPGGVVDTCHDSSRVAMATMIFVSYL